MVISIEKTAKNTLYFEADDQPPGRREIQRSGGSFLPRNWPVNTRGKATFLKTTVKCCKNDVSTVIHCVPGYYFLSAFSWPAVCSSLSPWAVFHFGCCVAALFPLSTVRPSLPRTRRPSSTVTILLSTSYGWQMIRTCANSIRPTPLWAPVTILSLSTSPEPIPRLSINFWPRDLKNWLAPLSWMEMNTLRLLISPE